MIKLVYPTDPNFGDAMSPMVVAKLSGQEVCPADMWNADMMAIGSVFYRGDYFMGDWARNDLGHRLKCMAWAMNRHVSRPIVVWGSGFLQYPPFKKPCFNRKLDIRALRGKYTRKILEGYGLISLDTQVAYGDPGLLFADLFGINANPKYDLGIIPHKYDTERGWLSKLGEVFTRISVNAKLINVADQPIKVVSEISECEKIISSSLHGLIVADSLGISNCHMTVSTLGHSQRDYELKFLDYYSAYGVSMPRMIVAEDIIASPMRYMHCDYYRRPDCGVIDEVKESLLKSFPVRFPIHKKEE